MKVGLCKELENHIFDYGVHNAADLMRMTQEKINPVRWYLKESRTPMLPLGTERGLTFEMDPLTSPFV